MIIGGKDIRIDGRLVRIGRLAAEKYEYLDEPEAVLDECRRARTRVDVFTFIQSLSNRSTTYAYPCEADNLAAVPVSTYEYWWTKQINGKTRNMVRRAEKTGVVVREVPFDDALVRGISAIYNECPMRQGRTFWHYGKDVAAVRAENGTLLDRSVFIGAFAGETLIGFAKLVSDAHEGQAGLMQILSMIQHRDKAPTNALVAHAVRSCADRRIPYLVYANFAYGSKQHDSLAEFKQHNGFERFDIPRYYVPVTLVGRAALAVGAQRGFRSRVPEPVLASLRRARRLWQGALARPVRGSAAL
jgi:hypothetical protein